MSQVKRPTRTFPEFFEHTHRLGFNPGTVIDVGAAKGTPSLNNAFPDAYFVCFEPLREFADDLERYMRKYKGEIHNCALATEEKESSIFRTKDLFGSSIMHRVPDEQDPRLEQITIRTLDGVLADRDLPKPYLLKTDCQGGDFDVVKGGTEVLKHCDLVIMEVSFFKFWGNHHPDALEILNFMNEQGFVVYDFLDGLFRPLDGALGQIDIVFVRKDSPFKKDHRWLEMP